MPCEFKRLSLPEVILITPKAFGDDRGFFMETYKESEFKANGIHAHFVQDNHSRSKKGVLRGLHYQMNPRAQGKLVRVIKGKIFDVVVDIRKGSPNYGKWVGVELSAENREMLWVPVGFAHGVLVMEEGTEHLYKVTDEWAPATERSILWNDPAIGIKWPDAQPILADKDASAPLLSQADNNFVYEG